MFFDSILAGYRKPCQQRYWQAVRSRAAYVPRCRRDGDYEPMQCDRQNCWCVEAQGTEINGTRSRGTVTCPPCKQKTLSVSRALVFVVPNNIKSLLCPFLLLLKKTLGW